MNDGATGDMIESRAYARAGTLRGRMSPEPHHRRRRALALALALVGLIAMVGGALVGSRSHPAATASAGGLSTLPSAAGPVAAEEATAQNAAINHTLTYTPYVRIAGSQHREIALTFDDGPGPYTPEIIRVLERENVPATFFEVGVLEPYFHASTTAILAHGWPIGDHTESHAPMGKLSPAAQRAQLLQQVSATGMYGAPFPRLFRPPYGSWDGATLRLLHRFRMLMVLWTVDTGDYRRPGAAAIVHAAVAGARPGAIILLHDAGGDRSETVEALPRIIRALRARGYELVTVPQLLLDNPAPRNQQISAVLGAGG